jgi:hypothetical protein
MRKLQPITEVRTRHVEPLLFDNFRTYPIMLEGLLELRKFMYDYCNCGDPKLNNIPILLIILISETLVAKATDPKEDHNDVEMKEGGANLDVLLLFLVSFLVGIIVGLCFRFVADRFTRKKHLTVVLRKQPSSTSSSSTSRVVPNDDFICYIEGPDSSGICFHNREDCYHLRDKTVKKMRICKNCQAAATRAEKDN